MKNTFSCKDFYISELGADARRERLFYLIISVLTFVPGAFTLWEIHYQLWHIIGSFASNSPDQALVQIIRMLPLYLTGAALIFMLIFTNSAYRAKSEKSRITLWIAGGTVMIILGIIIAVYVIAGVILGEYAKLIEGYITPLFPLDMLCFGLIFALIGILSLRYSKILKNRSSALPYVNDKGLFGFRLFSFGLLRALSLLIAMCSFAACIYAFWVLDLKHGYLMYSIVLWLNFLTAFAMYFVYKYIFCEMKESKRGSVAVRFGCIFLIANIILFGLHLLTVQIWNEAPDVTAFGLLPADFTAGMNVFGLFYGLNNILAPLIAIIRGTLMRKNGRS